jgi:hypothetical protein
LGRFDDARAELAKVVATSRDAFWLQRESQCLLALGDGPGALDAINRGLQLLKEKKYRAAFLHDRHRVRLSMGDPAASLDLEEAIAALPEGDKFRRQLEVERDAAGS